MASNRFLAGITNAHGRHLAPRAGVFILKALARSSSSAPTS